MSILESHTVTLVLKEFGCDIDGWLAFDWNVAMFQCVRLKQVAPVWYWELLGMWCGEGESGGKSKMLLLDGKHGF